MLQIGSDSIVVSVINTGILNNTEAAVIRAACCRICYFFHVAHPPFCYGYCNFLWSAVLICLGHRFLIYFANYSTRFQICWFSFDNTTTKFCQFGVILHCLMRNEFPTYIIISSKMSHLTFSCGYMSSSHLPCTSTSAPRAGSGVVRMVPLRFLAGCRTRRLNQA